MENEVVVMNEDSKTVGDDVLREGDILLGQEAGTMLIIHVDYDADDIFFIKNGIVGHWKFSLAGTVSWWMNGAWKVERFS